MANTPERTEIVGYAADRAPGRTDVVRLGALGINAWAVAVFVPSLLGTRELGWALAVLPAFLLVAGLTVLRRWPGAAAWLLLAAFPACIGLAVADLPSQGGGPVQDTVALGLAAASLVLFLAVAAGVCSRPGPVRAATLRPLDERQANVDETRTRRLRRGLLLTAAGLGMWAVSVVAPTWGSREALVTAWGRATAQGEVLTAVAAGMLAVASLTLLVAPSTRRRRRRPTPPRQLALRVALLMLLALLGAYLHRLLA